jgi:hypothetical protein
VYIQTPTRQDTQIYTLTHTHTHAQQYNTTQRCLDLLKQVKNHAHRLQEQQTGGTKCLRELADNSQIHKIGEQALDQVKLKRHTQQHRDGSPDTRVDIRKIWQQV